MKQYRFWKINSKFEPDHVIEEADRLFVSAKIINTNYLATEFHPDNLWPILNTGEFREFLAQYQLAKQIFSQKKLLDVLVRSSVHSEYSQIQIDTTPGFDEAAEEDAFDFINSGEIDEVVKLLKRSSRRIDQVYGQLKNEKIRFEITPNGTITLFNENGCMLERVSKLVFQNSGRDV
jgi:hypothetical protein